MSIDNDGTFVNMSLRNLWTATGAQHGEQRSSRAATAGRAAAGGAAATGGAAAASRAAATLAATGYDAAEARSRQLSRPGSDGAAAEAGSVCVCVYLLCV